MRTEILRKDLEITTYRSGRDCTVRIIHIPTGALAIEETQRSEFKARDRALAALKIKLEALGYENPILEGGKEFPNG